MWDARFDSIRDRKLNETVIFASMMRTDPANRHEYLKIIDMLGKDLDVLEALLDDLPAPESEPIMSVHYRGRLSKYESLDEYVMDECRKFTGKEDIERIASAMRLEAPSRLSMPERLSGPPEKARIKSPEEKLRLPPSDQPEKITSAPDSKRIDAPEEHLMVEPPKPSNDSVFDLLVSVDDAVTLKKVRAMKDSKIDHFIDQEMNGHIKDEACEGIISFLKTDTELIDRILAINITSLTSIEESIKDIIDFVDAAEEPKYQKVYMNSLNYNEKELEAEYNKVLKRFEKVIHDRYSHILGNTHSVFFEE